MANSAPTPSPGTLPDFFNGVNTPCAGMGDVFIQIALPNGRAGRKTEHLEAPKRMCMMECPIQSKCLAWAIDTLQIGAVWGGAADHERMEMRALLREDKICLL